ncbi:MAG: DUF4142 domain-containing protein [Alphaproteobacteria bacterium]|jgi:putative membrane protein|nr:DUF4142 domain-containing protein [Alphaproteobacteria bacterium]MBN9570467.1 DUF4142 domain-containing protein [Alphaproteobacteria bacterium]MBN9591925.1 DUF4142 domain-containing protein [Alphaproteobacteria bacterium]
MKRMIPAAITLSLLLPPLVLPLGAMAALPVTDFVVQAIKSDNAQILIGSLAQMRGQTQAVKDLGLTLVRDRTNTRMQMLAVAKALHVTVPPAPGAAAAAAYKKLAKLSGTAFDRAFLAEVIDNQKEDIAAIREHTGEAKGEAGEITRKRLAVVEKHLTLAHAAQSSEGAAAVQ